MRPVDRLLERLEQVRREGDQWSARCPAHHDPGPSLRIRETKEGTVLLYCHAGCSWEAVLDAAGLPRNFFYEDSPSNGKPEFVTDYVYVNELGLPVAKKLRYKNPKEFKWMRPDGFGNWVKGLNGGQPPLYHLDLVAPAVREGRPIWFPAGEKDTDRLIAAGVVATTSPHGENAKLFRDRPDLAETLAGASEVIIVRHRDAKGCEYAEFVRATLEGKVGYVRVVEAAEGNDAWDHLAAGHGLDDFVSVSSSETSEDRSNDRKAAWSSQNGSPTGDRRTIGEELPRLAYARILKLFVRDLRRAGIAGEERFAQLVFLQVVSRFLPWGKPSERPVSMGGKGSTSTGKSIAARTTLRFHPEEAVIDLGTITKRFLVYTDEDFRHKVLFVPEWALVKDDPELVAMLRTLLSEGRLIHCTVDEHRKADRIVKEGPTSLLMTTTEAAIDLEMETRLLSVSTDDSPEQTRRVLEVTAEQEEQVECPVNFERWHELQRWIEQHGEKRVVVQFVDVLAALFPVTSPRIRRDFVTVLCLVRAHAILHQLQRDTDEHGRIIATVEDDYAPVRELVSDVIGEAVDASVPQAIRDTVEAVAAIQAEGAAYATPSKVGERLKIGQAVYNRITRALKKGYLIDKSETREKKLVVGTPLPSVEEFLPSPEAVLRFISDRASENGNRSTMRPEDVISDPPTPPTGPPEEAAQTQSNGHRKYTPVDWDPVLQDFVPKTSPWDG